jgi:hypothetical protein
MLHTTGRIAITTNSSGVANVTLGSKIRGYLVALFYRPGTLETGTDLTVTAETSGAPILTKVNLGTGNSWLYPRALPTNANSATGPLGTVPSERIPLMKEGISVAVVGGGDTKSGTIEAVYETVED